MNRNNPAQIWMALAIVSTTVCIGTIIVVATSSKAIPDPPAPEASPAPAEGEVEVAPVEQLTPENLDQLLALRNPTEAETQKDAQKGIDSFFVHIVVDERLEKHVNKEKIQTKLELTLRQNKINLSETKNPIGQYAHLFFRIEGFETEGLVMAAYTLSVNEFHLIPRENSFIRHASPTWELSSSRLPYIDELSNKTEEQFQSLVEVFLNDYLSVNND
jgi:hypothetical protein